MSNSVEPSSKTALTFRQPAVEDAAAIHALIDECKPLDLNSVYCYMLLTAHFAPWCVAAEFDGRLVGFLSSYLKPQDPTTLFVWQVAVSPSARSLGVGRGLLEAVLARPEASAVRGLETTITPSNAASWALFRSFARRHGAECTDQTMFCEKDFGPGEHEEERLLRISPLGAGVQG